jgi:hypothetical protein
VKALRGSADLSSRKSRFNGETSLSLTLSASETRLTTPPLRLPRPAGNGGELIREAVEGKQMQRIAFLLKLKPGTGANYDRDHEAVWPEMLALLKRAAY